MGSQRFSPNRLTLECCATKSIFALEAPHDYFAPFISSHLGHSRPSQLG
jgi:hypothetical protein